jgi:NAD(P)H dehydrogenase (quinone)
MTVKIAVTYYNATGSVHRLAGPVAEGASSSGAEVRLRRVPELASAAAINRNPAWRQHVDIVAVMVSEATLDDLVWADGYAFGTPTRFGNPAVQLKQYIDQTGPLWQAGTFATKPVTAFTSALNRHGGNESTILALNNVFYHSGSIIVPLRDTDPLLYAAGGNPYGTTHVAGFPTSPPSEEILAAARYQGRRLAASTSRVLAGAARPLTAVGGER